jgi:hypothetical protein
VGVEPVMVLADQPLANKAEGVQPTIIGGQIPELAVEQRHGRWNIGQEARYPLRRRGFRLFAGPRYHSHRIA